MFTDGFVFTDHIREIIRRHTKPEDPVADAKTFLYEMLDPTPDRGDMQYRYEHCIRVAENAKVIARAEGLPEEPLVIACLLHDVGYRESDAYGGFMIHHLVSADIAQAYLEQIGYDETYRQEMILAIARHPLTNLLPEDMTTFQMSVRDCDDIDRFDMIRIAMALDSCVREKTNVEIIEACEEEIDTANWRISLKRGTKTADEWFVRLMRKRISLLEEIIAQAKKGFGEEVL